MEFRKFNKNLQENFKNLVKDANQFQLFEVECDKDYLWDLYLNSFPEGTNKLFRKRREYDCSCCRHFIKSIGNVVVIKDNEVHTIWEFDAGSDTFQPVANALDNYIKSCPISSVFVTKEHRIGTRKNIEILDNGDSIIWEHFFLDIPERFICSDYSSIGEIKGSFDGIREPFKNSLENISIDAVDTVLELINSNTLYRGAEWENSLLKFKKYKKEYEKLSSSERELYTWNNASESGYIVGKIKNHSIGVLLMDISSGVDLESAVRRYESIVAPANYKRPKAIFTKKMLEDAKKTIDDLGYMSSLKRRYATLDDISINNILYANRDAQSRVRGADDVFTELMNSVSTPKKFDRVEEININDFIKNVLPTTKSLEAYVENRHKPNFVSLIAPEDKNSKNMFKWNNNFSWAYTGNLTDSDIKKNVKNAGGKIDGVLRFSIQWNESGSDNADLDAHCAEKNNWKSYEIYFGNKKPIFSPCHGQLDVDIINPHGKVAVENIVYDDINTMHDGEYRFFVHQYSGFLNDGFEAEIEFNNHIYKFNYDKKTRTGQVINIATVILKNGEFDIRFDLNGSEVNNSSEMWGIKTNNFIPVSVMMYSPNYWDEQNGIGNKHYMFMLDGCVNSEKPNGFYNEFLKYELVKHKRVFEVLGEKMSVADVDDQLSGIGFTSTRRNSLIVKVIGSTERIMKIKF